MTRRSAAALLLMTALGCGTPGQPSSSGPIVASQDHAMIDFIRDLAQFVTRSAHSTEELAVRLGTAQQATGDAMRVSPSDARLRGVRIARYPDGKPFTIALELVRPVRVADLTAAFGRYETQERSEPGMPWPLIFHDAVQGGAARVSLLVEVAGPLAEIDRHEASVVTLRVDPVP